MATNRDASKQKRAKQNRAQREALKARTEAASRPSRTAPTKSSGKGSSRTTGGSTKAQAGSRSASGSGEQRKGFLSSFTRPRGERPGDFPVDVETLEGTWIGKRVQVPGGRQILTALLLTFILGVMTAFSPIKPDADSSRTVSLFTYLGAPRAILLLLLPVVPVAVAAIFTLHPNRRRIWSICTAVLGLIVVLFLVIYLAYLIVVGYLIYAIQRAKKIEGPVGRGGAIPARGRETDDADDEEDDDDLDDEDDEPELELEAGQEPDGELEAGDEIEGELDAGDEPEGELEAGDEDTVGR